MHGELFPVILSVHHQGLCFELPPSPEEPWARIWARPTMAWVDPWEERALPGSWTHTPCVWFRWNQHLPVRLTPVSWPYGQLCSYCCRWRIDTNRQPHLYPLQSNHNPLPSFQLRWPDPWQTFLLLRSMKSWILLRFPCSAPRVLR